MQKASDSKRNKVNLRDFSYRSSVQLRKNSDLDFDTNLAAATATILKSPTNRVRRAVAGSLFTTAVISNSPKVSNKIRKPSCVLQALSETEMQKILAEVRKRAN